jgi:hypothetical protein
MRAGFGGAALVEPAPEIKKARSSFLKKRSKRLLFLRSRIDPAKSLSVGASIVGAAEN